MILGVVGVGPGDDFARREGDAGQPAVAVIAVSVYSLAEIAIITRAGTARRLGLSAKGHLGAGAEADVAVYPLLDDKAAMFSRPRYVFKQGLLVVRDGEIVQSVDGKTLCVDPAGDRELAEDLTESFAGCYTVKIANYTRVGIVAACRPGVRQITAGNYGGKLGKHHFHLRQLLS